MKNLRKLSLIVEQVQFEPVGASLAVDSVYRRSLRSHGRLHQSSYRPKVSRPAVSKEDVHVRLDDLIKCFVSGLHAAYKCYFCDFCMTLAILRSLCKKKTCKSILG